MILDDDRLNKKSGRLMAGKPLGLEGYEVFTYLVGKSASSKA